MLMSMSMPLLLLMMMMSVRDDDTGDDGSDKEGLATAGLLVICLLVS
jgi:hypothetical protein